MRYQYINSKIWFDDKFRRLTPDQQRLFFYILTCPHGNLLGLFILPIGYISEDLKPFQKPLPKDFGSRCESDVKALREAGFIDYDETVSLCWIKNFLKYNPITNPNQRKAAVRIFDNLPKSQILNVFLRLMEGLDEVLFKALPKAFAKDIANTEPEPVSVPEKDERGLKPSLVATNGGDQGEKPNPEPNPAKKAPTKHPPCPYLDIVEAYHAGMPANPRIVQLDDATKRHLQTRWREDPGRQSIGWWERFFAWCNESKFLTGKKTDFIADIMWLVKPSNFAKVASGRYHHENKLALLPRSTQKNLATLESVKKRIEAGEV